MKHLYQRRKDRHALRRGLDGWKLESIFWTENLEKSAIYNLILTKVPEYE